VAFQLNWIYSSKETVTKKLLLLKRVEIIQRDKLTTASYLLFLPDTSQWDPESTHWTHRINPTALKIEQKETSELSHLPLHAKSESNPFHNIYY